MYKVEQYIVDDVQNVPKIRRIAVVLSPQSTLVLLTTVYFQGDDVLSTSTILGWLTAQLRLKVEIVESRLFSSAAAFRMGLIGSCRAFLQ